MRGGLAYPLLLRLFLRKDFDMSREEVGNAAIETRAQVPVLLVEDEPDYALLVQESLQDANDPNVVHVVRSGEEAIAYLSGEGKFADRAVYPFPSLILLDLRMPGVGGYGVLRWLHAHPELSLYVVVLSSIQSPKEIDVAYELGARFFWAKSDCNTLKDRVRDLKESWHCLN